MSMVQQNWSRVHGLKIHFSDEKLTKNQSFCQLSIFLLIYYVRHVTGLMIYKKVDPYYIGNQRV